MKDLKKIEAKIEKFIDDFNKQVSIIEDNKDFHASIIKLSAKYPEHKELLEFIVLINDKLETRQSLFSDMVSDSFLEMMRIKKEVIGKLIRKEEDMAKTKELEHLSNKERFINKLKGLSFKDYRFILILLAIIVGGAALIIVPGLIGDILISIK